MASVPITDIPDPSALSDSQLLRHIFSSVTRMENTLNAQQKRIKELEDTVDTLSKDVLNLKNLVNRKLGASTFGSLVSNILTRRRQPTTAGFSPKKSMRGSCNPCFNKPNLPT